MGRRFCVGSPVRNPRGSPRRTFRVSGGRTKIRRTTRSHHRRGTEGCVRARTGHATSRNSPGHHRGRGRPEVSFFVDNTKLCGICGDHSACAKRQLCSFGLARQMAELAYPRCVACRARTKRGSADGPVCSIACLRTAARMRCGPKRGASDAGGEPPRKRAKVAHLVIAAQTLVKNPDIPHPRGSWRCWTKKRKFSLRWWRW